jgi:hypothetical protein
MTITFQWIIKEDVNQIVHQPIRTLIFFYLHRTSLNTWTREYVNCFEIKCLLYNKFHFNLHNIFIPSQYINCSLISLFTDFWIRSQYLKYDSFNKTRYQCKSFRPLEVVATRDLYVFFYPLFDKYRNTFTLTLILIISLMTITFQ